MRRILGLYALVLVMSAGGNAFAQPVFESDLGVDSKSEPQGVFCEINGVKLMAKTADDCEKAGGAITHMITRTVTPAGEATDNAGEEPEIQRQKDKEPEAQ